MNTMNEKPILFSGEMVRAILSGRKTQTRRVVTPQPKNDLSWAKRGEKYASTFFASEYAMRGEIARCSHYGQPGDRLWVRETWRCEERGEYGIDGVHYQADDAFIVIENTQEAADAWIDAKREGDPWRPSIYMPRWASRITLDVVSVMVERVQLITGSDVYFEGVGVPYTTNSGIAKYQESQRAEFSKLWDSINAKRGFGWDVNPWVWVIEFKVVEVKS